mgnify:CR=1 FL=1
MAALSIDKKIDAKVHNVVGKECRHYTTVKWLRAILHNQVNKEHKNHNSMFTVSDLMEKSIVDE